MHPRLFEIPVIHWPVGTYGPMLVLGFLAAITLIRYLSKNLGTDPQHIINAALYSLIGGVAGARIFYVVHYFDRYKDDLLGVFRTWNGGLELLGGVIAAVAVILAYLIYYKLPVRRYLDILAVGLMIALVFGRIGCFLNGCCYGKPTDLPWAVRFPSYVTNFKEKTPVPSFVFESQVHPNLERNRTEPHLKLPDDYFNGYDTDGYGFLKTYDQLTEQQKFEVTGGQYRCLPVHPTQLYTSLSAAFLTVVLFLFWRRSQKSKSKFLTSPGSTFSLMFIVYGVMRFTIEMVRDDNPFEYGWWAIYKGGTVSQNLSIYMIILGIVLIILFQIIHKKELSRTAKH
ncbi:MAG: prolipoprotein diacylglyceryl transferase [Sedimentisphaerales bacterium]|nr:prolipoprotein diacylglyceryl transferase [Sedimentisphaerales bacterium]